MPEVLAKALAADPAASKAWELLAYTHRKEYARWVEDAKQADYGEHGGKQEHPGHGASPGVCCNEQPDRDCCDRGYKVQIERTATTYLERMHSFEQTTYYDHPTNSGNLGSCGDPDRGKGNDAENH